jgi:hypothetical protein
VIATQLPGDQESTRPDGLQYKHTVVGWGTTAPTTLLYRSVTVNWRVLVTQQVMEISVGVMVKVYGSPAVMVMSPVFVTVLPMAAASIVATPGVILEVAVTVALPPAVFTLPGETVARVGVMLKVTVTPSGVGSPNPSFTSAVRVEVYPPTFILSGLAVTVRV